MECCDKSTIHEFLIDLSQISQTPDQLFFGTFLHQVIDFYATLRIAKT
jgi:hypothetical protein